MKFNELTSNDFEIYPSGRVEKILNGSISGLLRYWKSPLDGRREYIKFLFRFYEFYERYQFGFRV